MDPETFSATLYKWDSRGAAAPPPLPPPQSRLFEQMPPPPAAFPLSYSSSRCRELAGLEDFFHPYGIRYTTVSKVAELGFTVSTLLDMRDEELEEMMVSLSQIFRWDLLVGEKYGIKAAIRAERRRLHQNVSNPHDALSQEGLSEEPVVQQQREAAGSGGGGTSDMVPASQKNKTKRKRASQRKTSGDGDDEEDEDNDEHHGDGRVERQREHPFIVTEPGEVARGKKNGTDYLFHLYEQCREFLIQVQNIAKDKGEKCPNKVTNEVFRYAISAGATYINKPKIRHYVHCYALHCLDEKASNALRKTFKGVGVGAWREACYEPLVTLAGCHGWDIDAIFTAHPRLSIWYVPTKLRKLCHAQRSNAASAANSASF